MMNAIPPGFPIMVKNAALLIDPALLNINGYVLGYERDKVFFRLLLKGKEFEFYFMKEVFNKYFIQDSYQYINGSSVLPVPYARYNTVNMFKFPEELNKAARIN